MYEFHYKYIGTKYDNSVKLLFTDTYSLVYAIESDGVYKDFYKNESLCDFSDYPEDSKLFDPVKKKVIGKLKNWVKGKIVSEFFWMKIKFF